MKTSKLLTAVLIGLVFMSCCLFVGAVPMGTAFTYQGRLLDNNVAADGLYDLRFKLYDECLWKKIVLN